MHRKLNTTIILYLIAQTFLLFSQDNSKMKIAILDFNSTGGISLEESITLTNRLRSMLVKTNALIVLERGKMEEILSEQGFQQTGCTSTECAIEVGKLLNVQKMVSGSIGKLGKTYTIDLSLIDVKTAQIEKSFVRDYKGEIDGLLRAGKHYLTWNGLDDSGRQAASGVYFYVLKTGTGTPFSGKMILLK
jgi:curli biogenesis system outer membrane secretion channel CsgG